MAARNKTTNPGLNVQEGIGHTVDVVIDDILTRIRSGELVQGQALVARNIAKRLGISVAPVREALHRLSGEGVVELFSNRSPRVRRLSRDDILNALEVWEVHAGLMARLAAQRIKIRDNTDRLRSSTADLHEAQGNRDQRKYFSAVIQFQQTLADIAENPYLEAVRQRLHTEFWTPQISSYVPRAQWPEYLASFERIEQAILSGDPDEAEQEYRRHIRWVVGVLRKTLPPNLGIESAADNDIPRPPRRARRN